MRHAERRQQHGKRDSQCGEERCAEVAQQREKHHHYEHRAVEKIVRHGVDGGVHEARTIQHGARSDTIG